MKFWRLAFAVLALLAVAPFLVPATMVTPVMGATSQDWNAKSFWSGHGGESGVHKGIDIFAPTGRPVVSASHGLVVFRGTSGVGGNAVAVLGPRWRLHYYAHLDRIDRGRLVVATGTLLGTVGNTGNAAGRPPHLHYVVFSMLPLPWKMTGDTQGWKRMFFLDPGSLLESD